MSASTQLVQVIMDAVAKKPQTKAEAVALFKYIMVKDIEPLVANLLDACILALPPPEQVLAKAIVNGVETIATGSSCYTYFTS